MIKLQIATDGQTPTYGINFPDAGNIYSCALTAGVVAPLAIPAGARIAILGLSSGNDYWVSDTTFIIPTSSTFSNAQRALFNPPPLTFEGVSTLYFGSPTDALVSVAFYS